MEPLKPEVTQDVLDRARPAAAPDTQDEIEEYERLLSERFTRDPDLPMSPEDVEAADQAEHRIEELHLKLFCSVTPNP